MSGMQLVYSSPSVSAASGTQPTAAPDAVSKHWTAGGVSNFDATAKMMMLPAGPALPVPPAGTPAGKVFARISAEIAKTSDDEVRSGYLAFQEGLKAWYSGIAVPDGLTMQTNPFFQNIIGAASSADIERIVKIDDLGTDAYASFDVASNTIVMNEEDIGASYFYKYVAHEIMHSFQNGIDDLIWHNVSAMPPERVEALLAGIRAKIGTGQFAEFVSATPFRIKPTGAYVVVNHASSSLSMFDYNSDIFHRRTVLANFIANYFTEAYPSYFAIHGGREATVLGTAYNADNMTAMYNYIRGAHPNDVMTYTTGGVIKTMPVSRMSEANFISIINVDSGAYITPNGARPQNILNLYINSMTDDSIITVGAHAATYSAAKSAVSDVAIAIMDSINSRRVQIESAPHFPPGRNAGVTARLSQLEKAIAGPGTPAQMASWKAEAASLREWLILDAASRDCALSTSTHITGSPFVDKLTTGIPETVAGKVLLQSRCNTFLSLVRSASAVGKLFVDPATLAISAVGVVVSLADGDPEGAAQWVSGILTAPHDLAIATNPFNYIPSSSVDALKSHQFPPDIKNWTLADYGALFSSPNPLLTTDPGPCLAINLCALAGAAVHQAVLPIFQRLVFKDAPKTASDILCYNFLDAFKAGKNFLPDLLTRALYTHLITPAQASSLVNIATSSPTQFWPTLERYANWSAMSNTASWKGVQVFPGMLGYPAWYPWVLSALNQWWSQPTNLGSKARFNLANLVFALRAIGAPAYMTNVLLFASVYHAQNSWHFPLGAVFTHSVGGVGCEVSFASLSKVIMCITNDRRSVIQQTTGFLSSKPLSINELIVNYAWAFFKIPSTQRPPATALMYRGDGLAHLDLTGLPMTNQLQTEYSNRFLTFVLNWVNLPITVPPKSPAGVLANRSVVTANFAFDKLRGIVGPGKPTDSLNAIEFNQLLGFGTPPGHGHLVFGGDGRIYYTPGSQAEFNVLLTQNHLNLINPATGKPAGTIS